MKTLLLFNQDKVEKKKRYQKSARVSVHVIMTEDLKFIPDNTKIVIFKLVLV